MNVPENRTPDGKKMSLKFYPTNERITMSQRSRNASMTRLESRFLVSRLTLRNDVMTRLQSRFYRMTEPGLRSRRDLGGVGVLTTQGVGVSGIFLSDSKKSN